MTTPMTPAQVPDDLKAMLGQQLYDAWHESCEEGTCNGASLNQAEEVAADYLALVLPAHEAMVREQMFDEVWAQAKPAAIDADARSARLVELRAIIERVLHVTGLGLTRAALVTELTAAVMAVINDPENERAPTQWAYDQTCAALHKHRERADKAEAERDQAHADLADYRALVLREGHQLRRHDQTTITGLHATIAEQDRRFNAARKIWEQAETRVDQLKEEIAELQAQRGVIGGLANHEIAERERLEAELVAVRSQVDKVRELHSMTNGWCLECCDEIVTMGPCATVAILDQQEGQ